MSETRRFVVTGGPGAGKSTLIEALGEAGHAVFGEAGRAIMGAHRAIGGPAGHDGDRRLYAELMLSWDMRSHAEAGGVGGTAFFDRGVPELIGYFDLVGEPVPAHFRRAAAMLRYADPVFLAPPWREIFVNDALRRQDFAEAVETARAVRSSYHAAGYRVVDLPLAEVASRVDFILREIATAGR